MLAIICDRCGKTQPGTFYGTNAEINRITVGSPSQVNLCVRCTDDFIKWLREGKPRDSNPE